MTCIVLLLMIMTMINVSELPGADIIFFTRSSAPFTPHVVSVTTVRGIHTVKNASDLLVAPQQLRLTLVNDRTAKSDRMRGNHLWQALAATGCKVVNGLAHLDLRHVCLVGVRICVAQTVARCR